MAGQITLDAERLQKIVHDLANKAAVAESALAMVEQDRRLPEALREDVTDASVASQSISGLVIELQKLVGLR